MLSEVVIMFVFALFVGYSIGYFLKISLKVLLFLLGFSFLLIGLLYYFGIIVFTTSYSELSAQISKFFANISIDTILEALTPKICSAMIGGLVGLYLGLRGKK